MRLIGGYTAIGINILAAMSGKWLEGKSPGRLQVRLIGGPMDAVMAEKEFLFFDTPTIFSLELY